MFRLEVDLFKNIDLFNVINRIGRTVKVTKKLYLNHNKNKYVIQINTPTSNTNKNEPKLLVQEEKVVESTKYQLIHSTKYGVNQKNSTNLKNPFFF